MLLVVFPPKQLIWMGSFTEAACIICGLILIYGGVTGERGVWSQASVSFTAACCHLYFH